MKNEVSSSHRLPVIRNRYFLAADILMLALAAAASFLLRLELNGLKDYLLELKIYILAAVLVKPLVFYTFGLYQRFWRYSTVVDLYRVSFATLTGSSLMVLVMVAGAPLVIDVDLIPSAIPFIDWLLTMPLVGGTRLTLRLFAREQLPWKKMNRKNPTGEEADFTRVLIMGAGDAGALMVEEMQDNPELGMVPVGFVDDNRSKTGLRIYNVPVLGTRKHIPDLVEEKEIDEVLIAMPTAPGKEIQGVVSICQEAGVRYKTIPGIYELIGGDVSVTQARDVSVDDLLRRDPVEIRDQSNLSYLKGAVVLVTGAGGSIGSELCRQIADHHPTELLLLGHGENSIYRTQHDLRDRYPGLKVGPLIADIRHRDRLDTLFDRYQPRIVFHAAAHKHVPLMEMNPSEAVTNNICGTKRLLDVAVEQNVERFTLVSTDKAVEPVNVMGVTKRLTELLVQDSAQKTGKPYVSVRFGNVLGSRGSVVPLFKRQIEGGGPVTVTHPEMKRFFMTIPEAVQLILQAAGMGRGGEIFVLDMGKQIPIVELAKELIRLSGLEPGEDIPIQFTGVRPGEKLKEELFYENEEAHQTEHEKILVAQGNCWLDSDKLEQYVNELEGLANEGDREDLIGLMQEIVPEYEPARHVG